MNYLKLEPEITTYSDKQIFEIIKLHKSGETIFNLADEYGMRPITIFNWLARYDGLETHSLLRLKRLEDENTRLKAEMSANKFKVDLISKALANIKVQDKYSEHVLVELNMMLN